jgi:hypothetical protein
MRQLSRILLVIGLAAMILAFPDSAKSGYAPDHPEYPRMTSRALGMGGATVAWIDDASSILQNPAGMGRTRSLSMSHAHSRNHLPGPIENLDQIDSDPTTFVIPLAGALLGYPIGSAGAGWLIHGEQGYDYSRRNDESVPHERLWGMGPGDRSEGAGFNLWPGGYWGFTHRMSEYLFSDGANLPDGVTWRRTGEGGSTGVQQTVIPGIQFGAVMEQMDYDYLPARGNTTSERTKSIRTGWCIRPTAWLTLARDTEKLSRKEWPSKSDTKTERVYWGVEIKAGQWLSFRFGSFDGHPSRGWSFTIGPWRSDSAWVDGFMDEMVSGYPNQWRDIHVTGFDL